MYFLVGCFFFVGIVKLKHETTTIYAKSTDAYGNYINAQAHGENNAKKKQRQPRKEIAV